MPHWLHRPWSYPMRVGFRFPRIPTSLGTELPTESAHKTLRGPALFRTPRFQASRRHQENRTTGICDLSYRCYAVLGEGMIQVGSERYSHAAGWTQVSHVSLLGVSARYDMATTRYD